MPAPLRWITRAFSSITLAVILLSLVAVYGMLGTLPVFFLALLGLYLLVALPTLGLAGAVGFVMLRRLRVVPWYTRVAMSLLLLGVGGALAYMQCRAAYQWASTLPWLDEHRATVIYRLPWFEMTEVEFYAWWPMQALLIAFVLNMIWATVRRIEFRFVNLGVLTVHAGIVVIAIGSVLYGRFKVEGDTILWRRDLGGDFERVFYDITEPAIYVEVDGSQRMVPLPELPRYNDYPPGSLEIAVHDRPAMRDLLGPDVRVTIPGFKAYGELATRWHPVRSPDDLLAATAVSPVLFAARGTSAGPVGGTDMALAAAVPAERVFERPGWTLEYLVAPDAQRIEDLQARFEGPHGLVVEVPGHDFRAVYGIEPGQRIAVGETGYELTVDEIGDYNIPFATEGYENATDTRALVEVTTPEGDRFTRLALHRYPERSQDFVPAPDDPTAGPMGVRRDVDPAIRLVYLDSTQAHYHLIADGPDAEVLSAVVRLPGIAPMWSKLPENRLRVPGGERELIWLYFDRIEPQAARVVEPRPTPKAMRDPANEGTYVDSLLPLLVEVDRPAAEGGPWRRLVWMRHMRYPKYPTRAQRPVFVDVPNVGQVRFAFSRRQYQLPFAIALEDFEMEPYPGSQIPLDYTATLLLGDLDADGLMPNPPQRERVHMNHPLSYRTSSPAPLALRRLKISQTGWDPPEQNDAMAEARDAQGRYINQQRFTILGIGNNVGFYVIATGAVMVILGIPWAFYIKPLLVARQKRRLQREIAKATPQAEAASAAGQGDTKSPAPARAPAPETSAATETTPS
ncbi:MAG: hypothetical protein WD118_05220 [Phycisphaeraceae bacterium]